MWSTSCIFLLVPAISLHSPTGIFEIKERKQRLVQLVTFFFISVGRAETSDVAVMCGACDYPVGEVKWACGWQYDPTIVALTPQVLIIIICDLCVTSPLFLCSLHLCFFHSCFIWMMVGPVNVLMCCRQVVQRHD